MSSDGAYEAGMSAFLDGKVDEAIVHWRRAVDENPSNPEPLEVLAVALARTGELDDAVAVSRQLVELDPDYVMGWTNLSRFLQMQGDLVGAEEAQAQARIIGWRQQAAGETGGAPAGPSPEAVQRKINRFEQIVADDPGDVLGRYVLGTAYAEARELGRAVACFEAVLEVDAAYTVAYLALGKCLVRLGRAEEAMEVLGRGVDVAEENGDLMPGRQMSMQLDRLRIASST